VFSADSSLLVLLVLIGGTTDFYATPKRQGNLLLSGEELGLRAAGGWCSLCFCLQPVLLFCHYLWGRENDVIHDQCEWDFTATPLPRLPFQRYSKLSP